MGRTRCLSLVLLGWTSAASANLVQNGDFELGNVDFSSDATFVQAGVLQFGEYSVRSDPSTANGAWCGDDHTSGAGLMLICDGISGSETIAWRQTVATVEGVTYTFSAWVMNLQCSQQVALPEIVLRVNGATVAGPLTLPKATGNWVPIEANFMATETTTTLEIGSVSTAGNGNDFAIDDIVLTGAVGGCPGGGTPVLFSGTGSYYQYVPGNLTWTNAKLAAEQCSFMGRQGHLVTITSQSEQDFISNSILNPGNAPWIGATDEAQEGTWRWVTGEVFWIGAANGSVQNGLYANWGSGQPDDGAGFGSEDYAYMPDGSVWNDQPGVTPNPTGYVVEFPGVAGAVPAVSEWGLVVMTLLVLTGGTIVSGRQRQGEVPV